MYIYIQHKNTNILIILCIWCLHCGVKIKLFLLKLLYTRVSHRLFKIWWRRGGGGLSQYMGRSMGGIKMLLKNTCDRVDLIVKSLTINLEACKFTKNELLHTYFQGFQLDFKLLFIVLFLGSILWKGVSRFNGGVCFSDWGALV